MSTTVAAPIAIKKYSVLGDYAQLFKVRVTTLIVVTAWAGCYMASSKSGVPSLSWTLLQCFVGHRPYLRRLSGAQ